jgi:hypothetical protein
MFLDTLCFAKHRHQHSAQDVRSLKGRVMGKSKTTSYIQISASRNEKSAAGEDLKSARSKSNARGASTTSADTAAQVTKYVPLFANIAKVMCQGGAAYWQLALAFQVDEDTIREWIRTYEDFAAGCKYGMNFTDDTVEHSLYQLAVGYDHHDVKIFRYKGQVIYAPYTKHVVADVEACVFWLINRRPNEWNANRVPKPNTEDNGPLKRLYDAIEGTKFVPNEDQSDWLESGGNYIAPEWKE